jgi:STE24 endopeptidase
MLYWLLLASVTLSFLIGEALSLLNESVRRSGVDPRVAEFYDADKYGRSLAYQRDKARFARAASAFSFLLTAGFLASGAFGRADGLVASFIENPRLRVLVFFAFVTLGSDLLSLPFELYGTFTLEARYGFNKTTPSTFVADKLKGYALGAVFGGGLLFLFMVLVEALGPSFWIVFAAAAVLIVILINMFYTSLILPLFNKLEPLAEGGLKDAVQAYAAGQNLSLQGVYVMDGSKRSTKANAFFSGLGPKKKIVLFDTLIEKHPVGELVSVLAHETGHLKLRHIFRMLLFSVVQITMTLWVFSLFVGNPGLSLAMGGSAYALELNLIAFGILFGPIAAVSGLAALIFSRRHEYQADAFAARTASAADLASALKRLSADNLSNLYPHPWYVFFNYSHPPLLRRLDSLERLG